MLVDGSIKVFPFVIVLFLIGTDKFNFYLKKMNSQLKKVFNRIDGKMVKYIFLNMKI